MSQQPSNPAGPGGDEWPDHLWPDEDDVPGGGAPARKQRFRPGVLGAVVLVAALTGAAVAVAVQVFSHSPASPAAANNPPSVLSPAQPGGQFGGNGQPGTQIGGNGVPGGAPGGGGIFMVGRVTAVTGDSITIGGPAHTATASVTSATKITGRVTSIGGIKAGDQVSAQITQQGTRYIVVALQYPAQFPAGVPGG